MTDLRKAAEMALDALDIYREHNEENIGLADAAYEELRQALAQPEQEPVAWMHNFIEGNVITHKPVDIGRNPERWTPLYTAPPKREWVWLTVEEMLDCWEQTYEPGHREYVNAMNMSRAVQVKSKEKNT